jgi:ubiquinone/menaquinone biosynthesis C-methylase UbiE
MSQEAFHSKWSDIKVGTKDADERVLFVDVGEKPVTQRQLNLYYYFQFIKNILEENFYHSSVLPNTGCSRAKRENTRCSSKTCKQNCTTNEGCSPKKVLEIGCGRGTIGLYLANHMGLRVSLLDNEEDAIAVAKRTFKKYGQQGAFYVEDALNTNLPDNSFDAVVSIGLAEHFESAEDVQKLFAEQYRVLRDGGVMISLNIPKKFSVQSLNTLLRYFKKMLGMYKESIHKDYFRNTLKPEEYKYAAALAGFKDMSITHVCPFPIFTPLRRSFDKKITSFNRLILRVRSLFQKYPYKTNRFVAQAHFLVGWKR